MPDYFVLPSYFTCDKLQYSSTRSCDRWKDGYIHEKQVNEKKDTTSLKYYDYAVPIDATKDHNNMNDTSIPSNTSIGNLSQSEEAMIPDIYHPSLLDHASNNDSAVLECTFRDKKTKTTNITHVTLREFYAEDSKCRHSFKEDTAFFHVGKAGGGTILEHLDESWGFANFKGGTMSGFTWVHPRPRLSINKKLQNGPLRTLILNVRDPVDRFVSAFNWRYAILCHPDDERYRLHGEKLSNATRFPNIWCKEGYEEEETMMRETYQSSPSVLAEALCHDSPLRSKAEQNFNKVLHSTTLTKWLHFLIDPSSVKNIKDDGIQQFIVLPLEKQPGANVTLFEQHIENLGYHLLSTRYGMETTEKMMQLAQEKKMN